MIILENTGAIAKAIELLKTISFQDAMSKIANTLVNFSFKVLIAIAVFYIGRFIIRKIKQILTNIFEKKHVDLSLSTFIQSFTQILLYFILVVTIIGILGIETSSFLALFASAGVAIGMALSGTLQNFAGGVLILVLKPYKIGDYIEAQGFAGTVRVIEMFNTIITTPDNKTIIIPNGGLSTSAINNSSAQAHRRVEWNIGISYGDSVEPARRAVLEMFAADPDIVGPSQAASLGLTAPAVVVGSLDDSAVTLKIRAWVPKDRYWDVFFGYNERFYSELPEKAGIRFPFPQMDVHLDKLPENTGS